MILSTALTNLKTAVIMTPYVLDGFNSGLAQSTAKKYIDPITTFLMWVVPLVAVIVCLISFVKWFVMDEDEKERSYGRSWFNHRFFKKHSLGNYLSAPMGDGYDMAGSHEDCYTGLL